MQRAPECDIALVHDDDLERIGGIGEDSVSRDLILSLVLFTQRS